ncbi:MarR family winged helix-turn-helix transcriptional regulator [Nocardiopsis coralliicola]
MQHEATAQGEHERARILREIESLNEALDQVVLHGLLQNLLSLDLTLQQLRVLTVLVTSDDGATGKGLAESFGISMATVSGILDRLVAQGVAVRTPDPDDHRVRRVRATALGTSAVQRLIVARPFRGDVLSQLQTEDLRALEQGFRAVSEQITRMGGRT